MSRLFSGATDVLTAASYPWPHALGAVGLWFRPTWSSGDGQNHLILRMGDDPSYFDIFKIGNNLYCGYMNNGVSGRSITADTGLFTAGVWTGIYIQWNANAVGFPFPEDQLARWVYNCGSSTLYFHGTQATALQNTDLSALTLNVGGLARASLPCSGEIGNLCVYTSMVAGDYGVTPLWRDGLPFRRPANLQDYWPLLGDESPEPNWGYANPTRSLTVSGATKGLSGPSTCMYRMGYAPQNILIESSVVTGSLLLNPDLTGGFRGMHGGFTR